MVALEWWRADDAGFLPMSERGIRGRHRTGGAGGSDEGHTINRDVPSVCFYFNRAGSMEMMAVVIVMLARNS